MNNQLTLFDRDSDYLESPVKDFDSKTASFRVHASLIYKLGESLIADEITALSELIKNAYDADATVCALSISSDYIEEIDGKECKGCIELSDNGCGMDLTTIVNGWLTLSNSPKKKMKKEQKTTPKYTIKYSTGTATIVSEFKNSFFYNREVLRRVMSGEFTLSETAVRDFLQTYKKDFPNVSTYFREGVSLISEDTCKFPDIAAPIFTDKSDSNETKKSIPIDPGIFECEIYEYSLDQKFLDYLYDNILC